MHSGLVSVPKDQGGPMFGVLRLEFFDFCLGERTVPQSHPLPPMDRSGSNPSVRRRKGNTFSGARRTIQKPLCISERRVSNASPL